MATLRNDTVIRSADGQSTSAILTAANIVNYAAGKVSSSDTRSVVTTPQTINSGTVFDFKQNSTESLSDGGTYFGQMTFRPYGTGTDWSGTLSHQLGFSDNGNIWQRSGSSTTWGAWKKILNSSNYSGYALPLSGGTLTGGLSGTTAAFSGQITNTIATGTAPLVITSTTLVSNLNVQYLNGQLGSYYAAASSLASYLPLAGGTLTGGLSGTTGSFSGDLSIAGNYQIRGGDPTITLRDTDHRTAFIHVNSNIFYILTGAADSPKGSWGQVANSRWPLEINLSTNNAAFGADVNAISFTGSGSGLTGTAASLSIGGNSANVNISNLNTQQVSVSLAAGAWYTIAANDGNRASAKFTITDTSSGLHQAIHFYATAHYGTDSGAKISVISNTYYSGPPVSAIKIMRGSTYDGAMVQIYALSACALTVSIYDNQQSSGWVIKSGVVSTTNPGTVATFASLTTVAAAVDLSAARSFSVSDEIYIGGATTQYKALHANNYGGYSTFTGAGTFVGSVAITTDASSGDSSLILHRYGGVNKVFSGYSAGQALFGGESGIPTRIQAGGQYALTALTNGNIGIGTTSPSNKLHVWTGTVQVSGFQSIAGGPLTFLRSDYNGSAAVQINFLNINPSNGYDSDLGIQLMNTAATMVDVLRIKGSTGNVGIGTTSPASKLQTYATNTGAQFLMSGADGVNSLNFGLGFSVNSQTFATIAGYYTNSVGSGAGDITFYTKITSTALSEKMRIQADGNVGIGTTSPGYKLQVNGDIYVNGGYLRISGTTGLYFESYGGGFYMQDTTWIRTIGDKSIWVAGGLLGSNGGLTVGYGGNPPTSLGAIIAGSVGIGTTSPSNTKLHIVGDWVSGHSTTKIQTITSFASGGTSGIGLYDSDGTRSSYFYVNSNYTSIGSAINTPFVIEVNSSEKLRILADGNVGIGTSSPEAKLHALVVPATNATVDDVLKLTSKFPSVSNAASAVVGSGPAIVFSGGIGDNQTRNRARIVAVYEGSNVSGLAFHTQNTADTITEKVRFQNNGNVGIGTTSPNAKLQISGSSANLLTVGTLTNDWGGVVAIGTFDGNGIILSKVNTNNDSNRVLTIVRDDTNGATIAGYTPAGTSTSIGYFIRANASSYFNGGNVGIGTSSPASLFQVGYQNASTELVRFGVAYSVLNAARGSITWHDSGNITGQIDTRYDGNRVNMYFGSLYNSGYNSTVRMTILGDGNVGIGTTSPAYKLDVSGTGRFTGDLTILNLIGSYQNTSVYNSANTLSTTPSRGIRAQSSSIQFTDSYAIAPYYTYRSTGDWPVPYGIGWGTGGESSGIFQRYASNGSSFGDMVFYTGNDSYGAFSFRRHTWEGNTQLAAGSGELNTELFRVDWSGNLTMLGTLNGSANSATLYPNNGSYGSWRIGGTKAGWYGLEFESGTIVMANSAEVGFYRAGYGWQFWWSNGTGYVHKGSPGGGTQATILDSSNYTSYTPGLGTNNTLTGINTIYNTSNTLINNQSGNLGLTMYQATAGTDAYMTFHIGGDFAAYFGLGGAENDLVYGGWSVGNVRHRILHSGNAPYAWNMNQYVRTTDSPTFNTVTANITGNAYNNLSNDYKDIYVYGDVNTYYVVLIQGEYLYSFGRYSVTRGYNWTGPDTWYVATHKGGLTLDWEWSGDTAWGGNDKAIRIIEFNESYSTMVAGLGYPVNGGVIIWLRGGGVNGALYRIRTPNGSNSVVTVYDGLSIANHVASTTFTAADSTVFSTRANTNNVSAEILARYPVRGAALLYNENNAVLHAGNYNSYSPTLTGTGASGTWGISVTGNAATAGGLAVHGDRNNEANKIVRTDSNGYIQAGWINTTSGDNGTNALDRIYASSDAYIRYYTPANFRTVLDVPTRGGSGASGSWGISVTGSSASCTGNAATATLATTATTANAVAAGAVKGAGLDSSVTFTMGGLTSNGNINIFPTYANGYSDFLRMGYDTSGNYDYTIKRSGTTGFLEFNGTQASPYVSYVFVGGDVYSGASGGTIGGFYFNSSSHGIRRASGTNDVYCYTTSGTLYLGAGGSSTTHVRVTSGGDVGIGVSPSYKLDVNGNIHATAFPTSSDIRFKKNIAPLENSLEKVKKLQGVKYEWNEFVNSVRDGYKLNVPIIGLIAQDVEKIVPEVVDLWKLSEDCQDARSIDYPRLIPVLIEAIKEQQTIIENQNQKIENLIARMSALEAK